MSTAYGSYGGAKSSSVGTSDLYRVQTRCGGFDTLIEGVYHIQNQYEVLIYSNPILFRSCGTITAPRGRRGSCGIRVHRDIAL